MSLLKLRVMTPASLEASRRNALKSTGPRTAGGKARSRLNALRHGHSSPTYLRLWLALMEAPPGYPVAKTVCSILTPEECENPVYANLIEIHLEMERQDRARSRQIREQEEREALRELKQSREAIENNWPSENTNSAKPLGD